MLVPSKTSLIFLSLLVAISGPCAVAPPPNGTRLRVSCNRIILAHVNINQYQQAGFISEGDRRT